MNEIVDTEHVVARITACTDSNSFSRYVSVDRSAFAIPAHGSPTIVGDALIYAAVNERQDVRVCACEAKQESAGSRPGLVTKYYACITHVRANPRTAPR